MEEKTRTETIEAAMRKVESEKEHFINRERLLSIQQQSILDNEELINAVVNEISIITKTDITARYEGDDWVDYPTFTVHLPLGDKIMNEVYASFRKLGFEKEYSNVNNKRTTQYNIDFVHPESRVRFNTFYQSGLEGSTCVFVPKKKEMVETVTEYYRICQDQEPERFDSEGKFIG